MSDLIKIKAIPKSGNEKITINGFETKYGLIDFWRWNVSDLLSNATRGRFAEFIVGTAIGMNPFEIRNEWDLFDLETNDGVKIEVKSAAYIQSWDQMNLSKISFSIKRSSNLDENKESKPKRHADVYVFCHLKHIDQETIDPMKMEQWDFYVVATRQLDLSHGNQSSISLNALRKLAKPLNYLELEAEIKNKCFISHST